MPRVIQVIESEKCEGKGEIDDPYRTVVHYHTLDGSFLAKHDEWKENHQLPEAPDA